MGGVVRSSSLMDLMHVCVYKMDLNHLCAQTMQNTHTSGVKQCVTNEFNFSSNCEVTNIDIWQQLDEYKCLYIFYYSLIITNQRVSVYYLVGGG